MLIAVGQNDIPGVKNRFASFGNKAPVAMMGEFLAESVPWVQRLGTEAS